MKINNKKNLKAVMFAISAAALYGASTPFSKILLGKISPYMLAALLYLGAGIGMLTVNLIRSRFQKQRVEAKITKKDMPFVLLMILLDIAALIFLMLGLRASSAGSTSLLNNFEIVATALIALIIFKEAVGKRMWISIVLISVASALLSIKSFTDFSFSIGSVFVLLACICWGFENNSTRMLSLKNPAQVVVIKGFGSGAGALFIALLVKSSGFNILYYASALFLGFMAFGMSIFLYIKAQRELGAARTASYYAAAPFIGVITSWIILRESMHFSFFIAFFIMLVGTYLMISEKHSHLHRHDIITHEHRHSHDDMHHSHAHKEKDENEHSHLHTHTQTEHEHEHTPDMHHRHKH